MAPPKGRPSRRGTRRYGVDTVNLNVRIARRVRERLHAAVEHGDRGLFVERAIVRALAQLAVDQQVERIGGELRDTQADDDPDRDWG